MDPPAPKVGSLTTNAAPKSSPGCPQLPLPRQPGSWGVWLGGGGLPCPSAATPTSSSPPGPAGPGEHQGASPGASLRDCCFKTPHWGGSKDRGLFAHSPEAGSPKSRSGQGPDPSSSARGGSFLLLQLLGLQVSLGYGVAPLPPPSWSHILPPVSPCFLWGPRCLEHGQPPPL